MYEFSSTLLRSCSSKVYRCRASVHHRPPSQQHDRGTFVRVAGDRSGHSASYFRLAKISATALARSDVARLRRRRIDGLEQDAAGLRQSPTAYGRRAASNPKSTVDFSFCVAVDCQGSSNARQDSRRGEEQSLRPRTADVRRASGGFDRERSAARCASTRWTDRGCWVGCAHRQSLPPSHSKLR